MPMASSAHKRSGCYAEVFFFDHPQAGKLHENAIAALGLDQWFSDA